MQNLKIKILTLAALQLTAIPAFAYKHTCTPTQNPVPRFELHCSPWIPQEGKGAVSGNNSVQFQFSNLRCDNLAENSAMHLSFAQIENREMSSDNGLPEHFSTQSPIPAPYGDQHTRLVQSLQFSEQGNIGQIALVAGARFDGTEQSTYTIKIAYDKSKDAGEKGDRKFHSAVVRMERSIPNGEKISRDSKIFYCSVLNEGVSSVEYAPATGFSTHYNQ
jgi:hypothetical protein